MNPRYNNSLPAVLIMLIAAMHLFPLHMQAQKRQAAIEQTVFSGAAIHWDPETLLPSAIELNASADLSQGEYISSLRQVFALPEQLVFVPKKEITGPSGDQHIRFTQQYKGLEMARTQYIMHLKAGRVTRAHGQLVGEPQVNLSPTLSKEEAYRFALTHLNLDQKQAGQNKALISRLSHGHDADLEDGKLLLSSGFEKKKAENFRLVYSFDLTTRDPLRRYDVEIDAHTGDLVAKFPTLYHENIPTRGNSLYNGEVDIVISDTIHAAEWPDNEAYWHTDEWNAYQGTGTSWWMADTANFSPGGYDNDWYVVLETDPIDLAGSDLLLTFYHRYALESPDGASDYDPNYDGWDGINVRISADGGLTWEVLTGPVPGYTCTSLWSFGGIHNEGPGIPGWAGRLNVWTKVNFNLSAYVNQTVQIRFDFASDGGWASGDDNSLFGWQIDEIEVNNSSELLYSNSGNTSNIRPYSIANWVGTIEGKYRLRETTRGDGIATINAESGLGSTTYVDFVQDTFPITSEVNRVGVSVHWASEMTYDYFLENYNRNSYDGDGAAIISYANWTVDGDRYNAFWAGAFAAYGAGDGINRRSYGTIDVVGHEITHGVTANAANLIYQGESGALNESFSDIFGAAVEFYAEGRDEGDWLVGEDIYSDLRAIRSMQSPKALESPDTYLGEHWVDTELSFDNGGVHYNSGVQNYWFYLLVEGGSGVNDDGFSYQVSGIGLEDASDIAYRNLTQYLLPDSRYMDAASYSIQAAEDLFGAGSQQVLSVQDAWEAVGIYMEPRLTASDTIIRFEALVDDSDYQLLVLRNKGIESMEISDFSFSDPDRFIFQPPRSTPFQIEGGDSLRFWIVFSPDQDSLYEETLTIETSDPLNPVKTIHLSAQGNTDVTGLPESPQDAAGIELSAYPNPFSERLLISYALPKPEHITIEIRDITGKLLYQSAREASGRETMEIIWNGLPGSSSSSSGGIYLLTLRTAKQVLVKKLVKQ